MQGRYGKPYFNPVSSTVPAEHRKETAICAACTRGGRFMSSLVTVEASRSIWAIKYRSREVR